MTLLIYLTIILFVFIIFLFSFIMILQLSKNIIESKSKVKRENYREIIIDAAMGEINLKDSKYKISKEIIDEMIDQINSFKGSFRRNIIQFGVSINLSEYIYKKFLDAKNNSGKHFYIYLMGELRCKCFLDRLLLLDIKKIMALDYTLSYFYTIFSIIDEWIHDEYDDERIEFINTIIIKLEKVEKSQKELIKRILDYFLQQNKNFFNLLIKDQYLGDYFVQELMLSNLSLISKGKILYILAINNYYPLMTLIKEEYLKYIKKVFFTREEYEYIIQLLKAAGELNLDESHEIFLEVYDNEKWVFRAMSAKYIDIHYKNSDEVLYILLRDKEWRVRYNSAINLIGTGAEGIKVLLKAIDSNDKFAREIATYVLENDDFLQNKIKELEENDDKNTLELLLKLINYGNGIMILDNIIREPNINNNIKLKVIENIRNPRVVEYYNTIIRYSTFEQIIKKALEKKVQNIFFEEPII